MLKLKYILEAARNKMLREHIKEMERKKVKVENIIEVMHKIEPAKEAEKKYLLMLILSKNKYLKNQIKCYI